MSEYLEENIKKNFFKYCRICDSFASYLPKSKLSNIKFSNRDLLNAATRVQTPKPFMHYVNSVEQALDIKFPSDLEFTKQEVIDSDFNAIKKFSVYKSPLKPSSFDKMLLLRAAIEAAYELGILKVNGLHSKTDVFESMEAFEGNTSAGFPYFKKKNTDVARWDAVDWVTRFLQKPELNNIMVQPTAVFHRFQYKIGADNNSVTKKIRQVWGLPFRILTLEGVFFRSMTNDCAFHCKNSMFPAASWGRTKYEVSEDIISHIRTHNRNLVSTDVSQFDAAVDPIFWCLFYAIVNESIAIDGDHDRKILEMLFKYHCFTPYCHLSQELKFQLKGVPSGSLITSLFDTFVNRTVINYSCLEYTRGRTTAKDTSCVLGDDIIFAEVYTTFKHTLNVYGRLGFEVSVEKSGISSPTAPFRFLGYIWDEENRPTESLNWYIAHLCMPSRFYTNVDIPIPVLQTYRGISICMGLYDGMKIFERLVGWNDYVYKDLLSQLERGSNPIIQYIGEDMRMTKLRIPLEDILIHGWSLF